MKKSNAYAIPRSETDLMICPECQCYPVIQAVGGPKYVRASSRSTIGVIPSRTGVDATWVDVPRGYTIYCPGPVFGCITCLQHFHFETPEEVEMDWNLARIMEQESKA